ncbi:MAG: DUF4058 family protein [Nitrospinae bacterium]|nr:DUF4058 family protein [Nitrospinota bacterium]
MPSPFPGVDPYLESPRYWQDFHERFITYAAETLQPQLPERYRARISERLVLEATERVMIPDITVVRRPVPRPPVAEAGDRATAVEVEADEPTIFAGLADDLREPYIEIIDRAGQRVVTVIELLSPVNKRPGEGRNRYLEKQKEVLRGGANLVEIDLLHEGEHTVVVPRLNIERHEPFHSLVCVWRATNPLYCELYFVRLQNRLPRIRIPLLPEDNDVLMDMPAICTRCYDAARYDLDLDYTQLPPIELSPPDQAWSESWLREKGQRS